MAGLERLSVTLEEELSLDPEEELSPDPEEELSPDYEEEGPAMALESPELMSDIYMFDPRSSRLTTYSRNEVTCSRSIVFGEMSQFMTEIKLLNSMCTG